MLSLHQRLFPCVLRKAAGILSLVALCLPAMAQNASSGVAPDSRYDLNVQAGPYSQVETALGTLSTTVPILHLKGLGNTSLDVDLKMRSNVKSGQKFANGNDTPGAGWWLSCLSSIGTGTDPSGNPGLVLTTGGDAVAWWHLSNGSYVPFNGVRSTLSAVTGGYLVTDERTLNQYYYTVANGSNSYLLNSYSDIFGNWVTFSYATDPQGKNRISQIEDASGRILAFNYSATAPYYISNLSLTAGQAIRAWTLTQSLDSLSKIQFPSVGASNSSISIVYDGNSNISTLKDANGNLWTYNYTASTFSPQPGVTSPLLVSSVEHPSVANNGTYSPANATSGTSDASDPTKFSWAAFTDTNHPTLSLYACSIAYPTGSWANAAVYRTKYHVYYNGYPSGSGTVASYFAPIYQEIDANVAADGQTAAAAGYHAGYTWNLADFTVGSYTDRNGNATLYSYALSGALANTGLPNAKSEPNGYAIQYFYNNSYRLIESVDNMDYATGGDRVVYTYNANNSLASQDVNPKADPYSIAAGLPTYAPSGALDITTNWSYNPNGTVASVQSGTDTATQYGYDAYGDVISIVTPSGNTWIYTYDGLGNKTSEIAPAPSGTTTWTVDALNRVTQITYPDQTTVTYQYDSNSNLTQTTDENSHAKKVTYDQENRPYSTNQDVDGSTGDSINQTLAFDRGNNHNEVTNGKSNSTTYTFDERNYQIGVTYPDSTSRTYHHDGNGNLNKYVDGRGYESDYKFDPMNRPTSVNYVHDARVIRWTYRLDGLRSQTTDTFYGSGTWYWGYNGAKLLTSSYQPIPNTSVYYGYLTQSGRRWYMATGPEAWIYNYDAAGRLGSLTQYDGDTTPVAYAYNGDDDVSSKTLGNGWRVTYSYDQRRRVKTLTHDYNTSGTWATQTKLSYARDSVGNITSYGRSQGQNGLTTNYSYDHANRLILEQRYPLGFWPGSLSYNISYGYDKNDSRSYVIRNSIVSYVTVDANDKFESGDGWGAGSYDSNGNPSWLATISGSYGLYPKYDQNNEPTTAYRESGTSGSFDYDMDHCLVATSTSSSAGVTQFLYDGDDVIAIFSPASTIYRVPGVGEFSTAYGQIYQMEDGTGNTIAETSYPNAYIGVYDYDSYGKEYDVSSPPSGTSRYRFKGLFGYQTEPFSNLVFTGSRQYVSGLGRFLQQDPLGLRNGLNLYDFAADNPINQLARGFGGARTPK